MPQRHIYAASQSVPTASLKQIKLFINRYHEFISQNDSPPLAGSTDAEICTNSAFRAQASY